MCLWSQPSQNFNLKVLEINLFFTFELFSPFTFWPLLFAALMACFPFSYPRISITGVYLHVSVNLTFNLEEYEDFHRLAVQLFSIQFLLFSFTFNLT
jgi:hypothetical protein